MWRMCFLSTVQTSSRGLPVRFGAQQIKAHPTIKIMVQNKELPPAASLTGLASLISARPAHTNMLKHIWKQPQQHLQLSNEEATLSHPVTLQKVPSEPALGLQTSDPSVHFVNVSCSHRRRGGLEPRTRTLCYYTDCLSGGPSAGQNPGPFRHSVVPAVFSSSSPACHETLSWQNRCQQLFVFYLFVCLIDFLIRCYLFL